MLSREVLCQLLSYDPEAGILRWQLRDETWFRETKGRSAAHAKNLWNTRYSGKEALTCIDADGYKVGAILGGGHKAHRVAWVLHHGYEPDQIDHINGIRHDNRIINLRDVSVQENAKNTKRSSRNYSGVVGVKWDIRSFKWIAEVKADGRSHEVGKFDLFWDAVAARNAAKVEFGFHANHGRE